MTPNRNLVRRAHLAAGLLAFLVILTFWTATVASELFGDHAAVATVKAAILWGMIVLVPSMAAVGASGFRLGGRSTATLVAAKRRRMAIVALNGLLVLVPSAVFLAARSASGTFDAAFYGVQLLELMAGAANLTLIALNMRDGFAMTRKSRGRRAVKGAAA